MTDGHLEVSKVLVTIEGVEQIHEDFPEGSILIFEFATKHSSYEQEGYDDKTEGGKEPDELIFHLVKHHDKLSKVLGPLEHDNGDHTRLNDDGGGNQLEVELALSGVSHRKHLIDII